MDAIIGTGLISKREYDIIVMRNRSISMSDGVTLDVDIFRPDGRGKYPALLAMAPFNKEAQSDRIWPAPTRTRRIRGFADACLEVPSIDFFVRRGYVLVIGSVRGTGRSSGVYQYMSKREILDTYEMVEWTAKQNWCDGNVGMLGQGYFAAHQPLVAALQPPNLKAIAPIGTFWDNYRHFWYPGGMLQKGFLRWLVSKVNFDIHTERSVLLEELGEEKYKELIERALNDRDILGAPEIVDALKNPCMLGNPNYLDIIMQPIINSYWLEKGTAIDFDRIKVPAYFGAVSHRPSVFYYWQDFKMPKRMIFFPPSYTDRPFYQLSWEMLRWFDYWLKGIDTGIMDEPAVKIFVRGRDEWVLEDDFPVAGTRWMPFSLHENRSLSEIEPWPEAASASYDDSPENRGSLKYYSAPLVENTEIIGPVTVNLYASCRGTDMNFIVGLWDVDPDGNEICLTRGNLKASHRELDPDLSKSWLPVHKHTSPQALWPGRIYMCPIVMNPTANLFKARHKIMLKISSADDVPEDLYHVGFEHLCSQTPNTITIYQDARYPSHIILPITRGNIVGTYVSGGDISLKTKEFMKLQ
ncbi:MAG: CocE/NonD family hydrolase [Deltaproteobacteria bacterium]|nr:CocE/NonD family hydrolase [Deltaproteobacteria bacterium]